MSIAQPESADKIGPQLDFTGERLVPEWNDRQIFYAEHLARYLWAGSWAQGKRVLDVACGSGYGSQMTARAGARLVVGLDNSGDAIYYAAARYRGDRKTHFVQGDARALPFARRSFDLVLSFETLEHLEGQEQFLDEIVRVLDPDGVLLVSTPNPLCYPPGNPYHLRELDFAALERLLKSRFRRVAFSYQKNWISSAIFSEQALLDQSTARKLNLNTFKGTALPAERCAYFVAACTNGSVGLKIRPVNVLFASDEDEQRYIERLRLDVQIRNSIIEDYKNRVSQLFDSQRQLAQTNAELVEQHREAVEAFRAEIAKRDEAVAHYQARERELWELLSGAQREASLAREEREAARSQLASRVAELEAMLAKEREDHERASQALRSELASLGRRLGEAEGVRRHVAAGIQAFQARFEDSLRTYRGQRAWNVMLFIRKAYTHLARRGWRGGLEFAKLLLRWPLKGIPGLNEYDLTFPSVLDYIPRGFDTPFAPEDEAADGPKPENAKPPPSAAPPAPPLRKQTRQQHYDLIVLPVFEFDYRFQRPQHLAVQFAGKGHRVFWVSPGRRLPESSASAYEAVPLRENLWEIHLRGPAPNIYLGKLEPEDVASILACLQDLYRDWAIAESCAMLQLPFWRRIGLGLRDAVGAKVVFDCMDEWETFPHIGEFNRGEQKQLVREADVLVVTGRGLCETYARQGLTPVLIRNGVDFDLFANPKPNDLLAEIPKPIVGYFGAIADWFDFELLREVARSRPQYSFVLIGGLGLEGEVIGASIPRLRELPNVFLLGHKPYQDIPSYLWHFDVCIIPFVVNRVTEAADPVKMYEYLSQGKPVVATAMAELAQCGNLVYIGKDAPDFAAKLDLALAEDYQELRPRRIAFAAASTWAARCRTFEAAIQDSFDLVSILVVTHNSGEFVRPCLEALRRNTSYPNYEVIAIDNNSADGTQDLLHEYAARDARIRLTCLPENIGFAAANNLAAGQARGEYLIFLNADTMVTSGWVERLLRHCRRDRSVGMVVPVTNWAGNEAKINVSYSDQRGMEEFALDLAQTNMGGSRDLEVGPLFCALVPRRIWESVGGLDEQFAVGMFEDDDFSLRIRRSGSRVITAEDCFVHHFGQGSFAQLSSERYQQIFEENRRRFEEKWNMPWKPHKYRDGIRLEDTRFTPGTFACAAADRAEPM